MNKLGVRLLSGIKYLYLVFFFALLSGFFHPLINGTSFDDVIFGVIVLFVGLAGGILVYKATTNPQRQGIFLAGGFSLIGISLFFIFFVANLIRF